jgi:hypothetical protein
MELADQMPAAAMSPTSSSRFKQYAVFPMNRFLQAQQPQVQEVRQQIETTSMSDFTNLDAQLREILTSSSRAIDDHTKVKIMNGILQRFVEVNKIMNQPFQFPVPAAVGGEEGPSPLTRQRFANWDKMVTNIERISDKRFALRSRKLLERLMEVEELAWNERGELIIAGKLIPASNIVTLVVDAASTPRKRVPPPTGWMEFGRLMERNNVSTLLIGNQDRYFNLFAEYYSFNARERVPSESGSPDEEELPEEEVVARRSARTAAAAEAAAVSSARLRQHPLNWEFPAASSSSRQEDDPLESPSRPRKGKITDAKRPARKKK